MFALDKPPAPNLEVVQSMVRSPRPVGRPPRESSPSQAQLPSRQPIPSPELITRSGRLHGQSCDRISFCDWSGGSEEPVCHVLPAWDCIAGQTVALALLAAERHRRNTGHGQLVELALKDVALAMLGHLGILGES